MGLTGRCIKGLSFLIPYYPADSGFLKAQPFLLSPQAWPSEGCCVRDVTEPGALQMEPGDSITIIEGRYQPHAPQTSTGEPTFPSFLDSGTPLTSPQVLEG